MATLLSSPPVSASPSPLELSPNQKSLVKAWWEKVNNNMSSEKVNRYGKKLK